MRRCSTLLGAPARSIIAEDLGVIPGLRARVADAPGIPGYKVLRWEREWDEQGSRSGIRAPIPPCQRRDQRHARHRDDGRVVGRGADSTSARRWPRRRRRAAGSAIPRRPSTTPTRDAILQLLYAAASDIVLLPIQDVFGWKDRINTPALINDENWTWRLPWLADDIPDEPSARDRAAFARALAEKYGR